MKALDTNVLARLLVDDADDALAAELPPAASGRRSDRRTIVRLGDRVA